MSLAQLYSLRIIQINVYLSFIQIGIKISEDYKLVKRLSESQRELLEERKQIRNFLNTTELWRLENVG